MFSSMFDSLFKKSKNTSKNISSEIVNIAREGVEKLLQELEKSNVQNEPHVTSNIDSPYNEVVCLSQAMTINDNDESIDSCSEIGNDSISEINSEENNMPSSSDDYSQSDILKKLNDLQCPFTWNLKSNKKHIIEHIENKYGKYNLDISSSKFTFERFIGNLIISYELFHKSNHEIAQLKIFEIGKWLEELDNGTDEFYHSIKIGLKHVMMSTFAHMLFATNSTDQTQWFLDDISVFGIIPDKPRAAVYAIKAAVYLEYATNSKSFKKANEYVKKACDLNPTCSYWFYLLSIILTVERQFLHTNKSRPSEEEKNAIQNAILLSDGCNTKYNFHRMFLERDTIVSDFHANKNDRGKIKMEKNLKDNKIIVNMIKTIMSMKPEDPHIVVKCARTLMTLPTMVRDIPLGKEFLNEALQMAPNDISVIKAVTNAIEVSKDIIKKSEKSNKQSSAEINNSYLSEELQMIAEKHLKGENAIPHLTQLLEKYDHLDKLKIMSQISSYSILFNNNLRVGVEQFMILMEQKEIPDNLIKDHYSLFIKGSKKFNLAELIINEISLAISSCSTTSADVSYYANVLVKILNTFQLIRKNADPNMCSNLKNMSMVCSSMSYQKENNMMDKRSDISYGKRTSKKNNKSKYAENNNSKANNKSQSFLKTYKNNNMIKNPSKSNEAKNKINDIQKKVNPGPSVHLQNLQTQKDIENYAKQVYNNIINRSQQNSNSIQNNHHVSDQPKMINIKQKPIYSPKNEMPSLLNIKVQQPLSEKKPTKPKNQKKK
ncbi:uncharacterized protein LOC126907616 isoform X2 [Daktulosphaira vitifoliae]|uniref:uncharacterized protein LOC126907616 isoform X2 n=1 Tax=Daktulosphaira vitifoliae TaxID=58002 RepID=UPI0021AADBCB|nr:uncharacterized protein LOC126907616 isoform X2 [Daktulosphaira vitifoliae]